jgi:hypothetical protein
MIFPPGTALKLDPRDEYTHTPEPVANYNESMYFNAFDSAGGVGCWMRLGNRPNEGRAEMSCCVYLPGGEVGFMHARPQIADNRAMDAGGLRFEVQQPFQRLSARYEGELLVMKDPLAMADPSSAFKRNPKLPALIELDFEGVSPMHGGEIVGLDGQPIELDPAHAVFRGHTEQHMAVQGHITVGGERHPVVNGTGYRDKSWGPRHWHSFFWYRWLPVSFDRDFGLLLSINGREGDVPHVSGNVLQGGVYEPIHRIELHTEWDAQNFHRGFTAVFETDRRQYELQATVRALIPLRHKPAAGAPPDTCTRITEALTEYRCEGRTALGMSEFCDVVSGGVPISRRLGQA